ncbi:MAG: ATP-binding cassette domain-containing protein, partial [Acholeplasmataceae bacterium]|nr:ATP-binding cassette domain-containing protein [Acholeplasmataceae bacterium]
LKAVKMHYFRGRLVSNLSGGQQQRVAIARAIVKNPKVILADEPTGNLDSKNTFEVMNIIKKIAEDRLVILVSHEKELVNHYADRIIEIKDGEIIHDFENTKSDHFAIDDNTLYLSDFEKDGSIKDVHWSIDAYREPESDEKKHYKVKLIVRNETLYLDFGNAIKNVRIVNNENNINIIEGSKSTEDKQQVDDTTFNMGELSDVSGHEKNPFLSLKKAFKDAFLGLFNVTKKTKMMLFVFFLMGVILAAGIPFINNVMSNRMLFTSDQEKYVSMTGILTSNANFKTIQSFKEADDDLFYINVFRPTPIVFNTLTIEGTQNIFLNANVGVIDHLDPSDIVYGKLPENQYEMVIDFSLILEDYSRYRSTLKRLGVWDFESVIGQKVVNQYLPEKPFVITGIVNTGAKRVYVARESVVFLAGNNDKNILTSDMFINDEDFVLTGLMPKSYDTMINRYEVLVPASYVSIYPNLYDYDFENGETLEIDFRVHVSGYYTYEGERNFNENTLLMPTLDLSLRLYQYTVSNMSISIYSQNPSSIILNAEDTFGNAIMTWPYQAARDEGRVFLLGLRTMMVLGIFLIVLSIASIYFLMKSSLSSRIYEISINRALGVKNKEIVKKFFVETFVLLTVSATFSYI